MADTSADEFSQFPVESIARFLTVCGAEDPDLLRRSRVPTHPPERRGQSVSVRKAAEHESQLEELVSIAVASARQAEDAVREVHAAGASARRRMFALAAFAVAAIFAGMAGVGSEYLRWAHPPTAARVEASAARAPAQPAVNGSEATPLPAGSPHASTPHSAVEVRVAGVFPTPPEPEAAVTALPSVEAMLREEPPAPTAPPAAEPPATTPAAAVADPADSVDAIPPVTASKPMPAQAPPPPAPVAVASAEPEPPAAPVFVPPHPLPPEPGAAEVSRPAAQPEHARPAPSVAKVHVAGARATPPSRLVAAVQALESLTDELPATPAHAVQVPALNNRM